MTLLQGTFTMKNTLFTSILFSMFAIHGVNVIQKSDSNQANISITIKEIFADTENNCYYYELNGVNATDIYAYCDAQGLPLKNPNTQALQALQEKYQDIIQKYKDDYYSWYYGVNSVLFGSAGLIAAYGYNHYDKNTTKNAVFLSAILGVAGIFYNIVTLSGDRSKDIDLSHKIGAEMSVSKKEIVLRSYNELTPVYTFDRRDDRFNNGFRYVLNTKAYLNTVNGYNKILLCTSMPLTTIYYTITPEVHPDFRYKVEFSLN